MLRRLFISLLILSALASEGLTNLPAYLYNYLNSENIVKQPQFGHELTKDIEHKQNNQLPKIEKYVYFTRQQLLVDSQGWISKVVSFKIFIRSFDFDIGKLVLHIEQIDNLSASGLSPPTFF